ncbi:MAG: universal stress protein [Chloroflexi bacterium]|nr:universal stress protein [Chloroflexota bacterium]
MFQNLLVPLDGSQFGELALTYALSLAQKYAAHIILLHVVPSIWEAEMRAEVPESEDIALEIETEDATDYLHQKEALLRNDGFQVTAVILKGEPVHIMILKAIETENADTIIMSTHGFTGVRRLMFGNIAEKVINKATVPVLLIRPPEKDF